jgi:rubrerythrin
MAELVGKAPELRVVIEPEQSEEEFGLRINWQSEDERIGAAEFLLATRMQEDARRRMAAAAMAVREHTRESLTNAIHQRPPHETDADETGADEADADGTDQAAT